MKLLIGILIVMLLGCGGGEIKKDGASLTQGGINSHLLPVIIFSDGQIEITDPEGKVYHGNQEFNQVIEGVFIIKAETGVGIRINGSNSDVPAGSSLEIGPYIFKVVAYNFGDKNNL